MSKRFTVENGSIASNYKYVLIDIESENDELISSDEIEEIEYTCAILNELHDENLRLKEFINQANGDARWEAW